MKHLTITRLVTAGCLALGAVFAPSPAAGQLPGMLPQSRFELSGSVELDQVDSTVRGHIEQIDAYLADRQWEEAVEATRELMAVSPDRLIGVTPTRFVRLRDYLQLKLAGLPAEAIELYRRLVDPLARTWYEEGIARRNRALLGNVVQQAFVSSYGDDALLVLGDMALERSAYPAARWHFERILPADLPADASRTWPGYPDSDVDPAAVRARLVLVSILEGSDQRARDELAAFKRLHSEASGPFGGRQGNFAETLERLLAESAAWPEPRPDPDWRTFAGDFARSKIAPVEIDAGHVVWRVALQKGPGGDPHSPLPVTVPPAVHPLVVGDLVLAAAHNEVKAVRLASGKPAWGQRETIFRAEMPGPTLESLPAATLGHPCYTMTADGNRLFARSGMPLSMRPSSRSPAPESGSLVCLDLAAEGRLAWTVTPEEGWTIDGAPVVDGRQVYVAMRRSDVRPQAHVACFDAQTGRRRWRCFVCGAETPARGILHEATHNLLTLVDDTLYLNTNLGAVASIDAGQGRLNWVSLYPRAAEVDLARPAGHWQRQLNPCIYHRGTLLVAPADSPRIFAVDAASGQILWQTGEQVGDVRHLLGVSGRHLIASGDRLYWIGIRRATQGRLEHVWPEGDTQPAYGRGLLAGRDVLLPTRDRVLVFDQATARLKKTILLEPLGAGGGNLLVAGQYLLIATKDELMALGSQPGDRPQNPLAGATPMHGWTNRPSYPKY